MLLNSKVPSAHAVAMALITPTEVSYRTIARLCYVVILLSFLAQVAQAQNQGPQNNTWYSVTQSDTVFVFVHGIFSDSANSWTARNGTYWPSIVKDDKRFGSPSIYLGGYFTDFTSGIYRVSNAADELLSNLKLQDAAGNPAPLSRPKIVFIAHSTGGLVVRYMLERHVDLFRERTVGLVLLASPSRGSAWSNRLQWIRELYRNRMAGQLARDNDFIVDLDSRFADFVQQRKIRNFSGIDAFENKFIIPGIFFNSEYVVSPADSSSYFGAYRIVPNTDHFSIAKPTSITHASHQLLVEFYETLFKTLAESDKLRISEHRQKFLSQVGGIRILRGHYGFAMAGSPEMAKRIIAEGPAVIQSLESVSPTLLKSSDRVHRNAYIGLGYLYLGFAWDMVERNNKRTLEYALNAMKYSELAFDGFNSLLAEARQPTNQENTDYKSWLEWIARDRYDQFLYQNIGRAALLAYKAGARDFSKATWAFGQLSKSYKNESALLKEPVLVWFCSRHTREEAICA